MDASILKDDYKVFPREPRPKVVIARDIPSNDSLSEWADIVPSGVWLVLFLFYWGGVGYGVQTILEWLHIMPLLSETRIGVVFAFVLIGGTPLFIIGAVIYLMVRLGRKQTAAKVAKLQAEANEAALNQSIAEAASVTNQLHQILADSAYCETSLGHALDEARSWLRVSQREYDDNVPGPFWDAIETCAYRLSDYNSLAQQLSNHARRYYSLLQGRKHTFPTFPIDFADLPDAARVIDDLYQMVRLGQTADPKPHFYDVWERRQEHRLTRQVMIDEFATLRDVISNVGRVLNQTLGGLRTAVTSGVANLSEDHAATVKSLTTMLVSKLKCSTTFNVGTNLFCRFAQQIVGRERRERGAQLDSSGDG